MRISASSRYLHTALQTCRNTTRVVVAGMVEFTAQQGTSADKKSAAKLDPNKRGGMSVPSDLKSIRRNPKKCSIRPHQSEEDLIHADPFGRWEITSEQINLSC